ncbi:hypothetical protein [Caulobacter endophyticus]|uniref:Uncharacterized protein n=1 Tax=Caulobacter endophyticus TaxID=2172652 RepID=A0A2T9JIB8_9CAUL|nr:hypothetical protein [Caulobacter endophyticus]PVM83434.1 hypothetical protein DDF67_21100 [Caulobacter endophyticus]
MKTWLSLLGGLAVWAGHFLAAYVIASIAEIADPQHRQPLMMVFVALTIACVLAASALALRSWRTTRQGVFVRRLSAFGSAVAAVAIVWQSLPVYWAR